MTALHRSDLCALRVALASWLMGVCFAVGGATLPAGFTETQISGLSNPTAFEIAPDGRVFVCQQGGQLRLIKNGALLPTPFLTVPVNASGERGLLGVAFDPTNREFLVSITLRGKTSNKARFRIQ
jgi:glucose/arabinose dehydrogenase